MMQSLEQMAASFGLKVDHHGVELKNLIAQVRNEKKILGVWMNQGLSIYCNPELHRERLSHWKDEKNIQIDSVIQIDSFKSPMDVLKYFSRGFLDCFWIEGDVFEFPKAEYDQIAQFVAQDEKIKVEDWLNQFKDSPFLLNFFGKILNEKGLSQESSQVFKYACSLESRFAEPYDNLGVLLWNAGAQREAFILFAEGVLKNPYIESARNNFLDAGYELREYLPMVKILTKVLDLCSEIADLHYHLALVAYKSSLYQLALQEVDLFLGMQTQHPEGLKLKNMILKNDCSQKEVAHV